MVKVYNISKLNKFAKFYCKGSVPYRYTNEKCNLLKYNKMQ